MITAGRTSRKNFKVRTAVDRVMAGFLFYSEGILLWNCERCVQTLKKLQLISDKQQYQSISYQHFCRTAPRSNLRPCFLFCTK